MFTVDDDHFIYGTNIKFAVSQVIYQTEKMLDILIKLMNREKINIQHKLAKQLRTYIVFSFYLVDM